MRDHQQGVPGQISQCTVQEINAMRMGDRRNTRPDRRRGPTPVLKPFSLGRGRRTTIRRASDRRRYFVVDVYGSRFVLAILALAVLAIGDAFFTLYLKDRGLIVEANPIMAFYLEQGDMTFYWAKYLLTALALVMFCLFRHFRLTKISIVSSMAIYSVVILYHLTILFRH